MLRPSTAARPSGDPERIRLRAIRRRWMRLTQRIPARISWWAEAGFVPMTYRISVLLTLLVQPIDEAVWRMDQMIQWFLPAGAVVAWRPDGSWAVAALAIVWLGNALLLHAWLEKRTPSPLPCRRWVTALRCLASGIPLLGLYVFPAWRWLESIGPMVWLLVLSFVALWVGALWLSYPEAPVPGRKWGLLVLAVTVHLLLFAGIAFCLRDFLRRPAVPHPRIFLVLPFVFFLPPLPYLPFLGFLLLNRVRPETGPARTLIHPALQARTRAARLPLWLYLEDALRRRRPRDLPDDFADLAATERRVLRLYDLKTLALGLDAGILGWAVARLAGPAGGKDGPVTWVVDAITWGALGIAGLAFLVAMAHYISAVLRLSGRLRFFDRHPYPSFLLRTQLAFGLGLGLGHELANGWSKPGVLGGVLYLLLILLGFRLFLIAGAAWTRLAWRRPLDFLSLLLPIVALGAGLAYVARQPDPVAALARLPGWWLAASLFLGLLLSLTLLPWLLRPDRLEQIFSRGTPPRLRARLAAFALPTLLPLGGIAVPLWIYLRQRRP